MASSCEPIFKVTIGIFGGKGGREGGIGREGASSQSSAQSRFSSLEAAERQGVGVTGLRRAALKLCRGSEGEEGISFPRHQAAAAAATFST